MERSKVTVTILFPADQVNGATLSSQSADSTERKEKMDEGVEDGEPNAAELRRRRLRKLETTPSSSSSPPSPPPDN